MQTKIISIPTNSDERWKLSFMQTPDQIPFEIKRLYYIYDLSWGSSRGHHAHKITRQILFCIQWTVEIELDDWNSTETVILNEPNKWVIIEAKVWHKMQNYSKNCIMLVLASEQYNEEDYIRDYEDFLSLIK